MFGLTLDQWAHAHAVGYPLIALLILVLCVIHDRGEKGIFDRRKR